MKSLLGNELPLNHVFVAKPNDLGTITNAYTNLRSDSPSTKVGFRLPLRLAALAAGLLLGYAIGHFFHLRLNNRFYCLVGGGVIGILSIRFYGTPDYYNVFLGTKGFAEYKIDHVAVSAEKERGFLFENAAFLISGKTDAYTNGRYSGTSYFYKWHDKEAVEIFNSAGSYNQFSDTLSKAEKWPIYNGGIRYHFYHLLEQQWTSFLMQETLQKVKANNDFETEFHVFDIYHKKSEGSILVHPHRLTVELNDVKKVFNDDELKSITLEKGMLKIIDTEYRWRLFSNKGNKIEIPISQISNHLFFLEIINLYLKIKE